MSFTHLTAKSEKVHTLTAPGKQVFLLVNQSGDFSFKLDAPDAKAYIFALFTGKDSVEHSIKIDQIHNAPKTTSHVVVQYLGKDTSSLRYEGLIRIAPSASQSAASQKNTNLIISDKASAFSFPSLEILTDDVICHHGSTTSRINKDHLFYAQSRGISVADAEQMLADGFIESFFDSIEKVGVFPSLSVLKEGLVI
ncbi:MAG: SufD family Fe-S cluster assembly protein [Candidatus Moranbacteria bacterium]|nr:SufD family Fe-S cluster assembly protein [Candidatus Moranbacteria bacterium]